MKDKKTFYITTTLPYVNAKPHLGHALEFVQADIIARYKALRNYEVFFNTGTDEHGSKVYLKALEENKDPQIYCDQYAENFRNLVKVLGLQDGINFMRTTDPKHKKAAQDFWIKCKEAGDIYKKNYKIKYCIGCELEKTDSELDNGRCSIHPNLEIEIREEENYFFAFSKYGNKLLSMYEDKPDFLLPSFRLNEIKVLISEKGLEDFSISRLKEKMPWGVEVPDDTEHVMYVWFDALVNYISAISWPENIENFNKWWPVTQMAGKDQVRQQAAMWQAMLLSVGLPPSKQIIIHGFINSNGQKMSKSLGNVIDPIEIINEYGTEALRYFLAREVSTFEDSDFTIEKFKASYNAHLANGIGNLVSRILKMSVTHLNSPTELGGNELPDEFCNKLDNFDIQKAAGVLWKEISDIDQLIQQEEPFKVIKDNKEMGEMMIRNLVRRLYDVANMLEIFMPETAVAIKTAIKENKMPETPLFPRKD